ncbi:MAG: hypothetical protein AB2L20_08055 [Mangrovibacterium sp.]
MKRNTSCLFALILLFFVACHSGKQATVYEARPVLVTDKTQKERGTSFCRISRQINFSCSPGKGRKITRTIINWSGLSKSKPMRVTVLISKNIQIKLLGKQKFGS